MAHSAHFPHENPSWDLDALYAGGARSEAYAELLTRLTQGVSTLRQDVRTLMRPSQGAVFAAGELQAWVGFLGAREEVSDLLHEAWSFAHCVASAHADDAQALRLPGRLSDIETGWRAMNVELGALLRGLEDAAFARLAGHGDLGHMALALRELRHEADASMDPSLEALAVELNRDGLHAWAQLYEQTSARLRVRVARGPDEEAREMSVGQAKILLGDEQRAVRRAAFEGLQDAWTKAAPTCAAALTGIIGAEQTLYRRRGGDALTEPLHANRVSRATVEAMHEAARQMRPLLWRYLGAKARALGVERLEWYDLTAPVGQSSEERIAYPRAQEFIVEQVDAFSANMGQFYRQCMSSGWVEVEDRPGKAQGGFCTTFPVSRQVRIFMTYGGTASGVQTLAHELGHAYHGWVMRDLRQSERIIPMGLAETASTLSEALVEAAALGRAEGMQRYRLLDDRLFRAVAFLIDVPSRFALELKLHELRAQGQLNEDQLSHVTTEIFTEAFGPHVASVDPTFWASKLHFYISTLPFYNFPYTFGYLFSKAVYERAREQGPAFAGVVDDLLLNSGRLGAEEIGRRYLDADLTQAGFWAAAVSSLEADVAAFEELVASFGPQA